MFWAFSLCQSGWANANLVAKIGGLFIHCLWSHLYYYFCRTNIATSKWSIAVPLSIGNISSLLIWLSTQSISKEIYWTKNKQKCITQSINMHRNFSSMLGLKKWLRFQTKFNHSQPYISVQVLNFRISGVKHGSSPTL